MTKAKVAERLGVSLRTFYRYMDEPGWPKGGTFEQMQEFVDGRKHAKRPPSTGAGGGTMSGMNDGELRRRKLQAEIAKLEQQTADGRERIVSDARQGLRLECEAFLADLHDAIRRLEKAGKMPAEVARPLNAAIARCLKRAGDTACT